jgi:hypothetical protein
MVTDGISDAAYDEIKLGAEIIRHVSMQPYLAFECTYCRTPEKDVAR